MPYKDSALRTAYNKGYYAGYRKATIHHLGSKCFGCNVYDNIEIHHTVPILRKARTLKDLKDLTKLALLCKKCHIDRLMYK